MNWGVSYAKESFEKLSHKMITEAVTIGKIDEWTYDTVQGSG